MHASLHVGSSFTSLRSYRTLSSHSTPPTPHCADHDRRPTSLARFLSQRRGRRQCGTAPARCGPHRHPRTPSRLAYSRTGSVPHLYSMRSTHLPTVKGKRDVLARPRRRAVPHRRCAEARTATAAGRGTLLQASCTTCYRHRPAPPAPLLAVARGTGRQARSSRAGRPRASPTAARRQRPRGRASARVHSTRRNGHEGTGTLARKGTACNNVWLQARDGSASCTFRADCQI